MPNGKMKKGVLIKPRDVLIILGILVAIIIGVSTQWAMAGALIFDTIIF